MENKKESLIKVKEKNKLTKKKISGNVKFIIVAVVLISIFCVALTPVTLQNDTFYTIKVGEHIAKQGIDMQDPFSWHQDLPYTYPHWLYDYITYLVYNTFGMTGIYICTCILSVILGLTVFLINKKLVKNNVFSFLITIGVMYLIRGYIAARAQLVTFILLLLTVYFIEKFLEGRKIRYALGLIIIPILIANLHAAVFPFYFVLYLPYIAEYVIVCLADFIIYRKAKSKILKLKIKINEKKNNKEKVESLKKELAQLNEKIDKVKIKRTKELQNPYKIKLTKRNNTKYLIIIMIICAFTGLLTPIGTTPYTYLEKTMAGNTTKNINEHLPIVLSGNNEILCTLILFLGIIIFTKVKIRLCDLFMISGLCYLMLSSRRQLTIFALISSLILNRFMIQLTGIYTKEKIKQVEEKIMNFVRNSSNSCNYVRI